MAVEIERKFLVVNDAWKAAAGPGRRCCQGHIARDGERTVRIRRAANRAFLTVKGERDGLARAEFEYEIPVDDAEEMLATLCQGPLLLKMRYEVEFAGLTWEIDVFLNPAQGLVVAEVELDAADQTVTLTPWIGEEVTDDPRYRSAVIAVQGAP
jgi:adenylate cyclase